MALDTCLSGKRVTNTRLLLIEYSDGGVKTKLHIQQEIAAEWIKLAPFLGFRPARIKTIKQSNSFKDELCAGDMLSIWMRENSECTWRNLILNMRKAQLSTAADDLAKALRNIVQ